MIKEIEGEIFSIVKDNPIAVGCTVSKEIFSSDDSYISHFSLAENTDISAEIYSYPKFLFAVSGDAEVYTNSDTLGTIATGDCIVTPIGVPIGIRTEKSIIYTEISFGRNSIMNNIIKPGEIFSLKELLPYQDGKIVNMDVAHNEKMKFVVMSFDKGTGLAEHAAPGEALIFALDGEGVIGYEGKEYRMKAGENFKFAKNGKHYVKATERFKMALLLILE